MSETWFTDPARVAVDLARELTLTIDRIDAAIEQLGRGGGLGRRGSHRRAVVSALVDARNDAQLVLGTTYGLPYCSECGQVATHRGTCSRQAMAAIVMGAP
jgi:hypothetical protein